MRPDVASLLVERDYDLKTMVEQPSLCGLRMPVLYVFYDNNGIIICGLDDGNEENTIKMSSVNGVDTPLRSKFIEMMPSDPVGYVLTGTMLDLSYVASELMTKPNTGLSSRTRTQVTKLLEETKRKHTFDPFGL
jgi:hypothetical protein